MHSRLESLPSGKLRKSIDLKIHSEQSIADGYEFTEIKFLILENLHNFKTLESLEEASQSFKDVSRTFYTGVVTSVTLNELLDRDIDIFSLAHCSLVEILAVHPNANRRFIPTGLEPALKSIKGQLSSPRNQRLLLDIDSCFVLRKLRDLVVWNVSFVESQIVCATYIKVPEKNSWYWRSQHRIYVMVYLGDEWVERNELQWAIYGEYYKAREKAIFSGDSGLRMNVDNMG